MISARQVVARGFTVNREAKSACVAWSVSGKLKFARNLRRLLEAIEPAENELVKERDRLFDEERATNPEAKELTGPRVPQINKFVRELNAQTVDLDLDSFAADDLDLDKFDGEEAIQALSVLDGLVLFQTN